VVVRLGVLGDREAFFATVELPDGRTITELRKESPLAAVADALEKAAHLVEQRERHLN
jgi:hypothetical protein